MIVLSGVFLSPLVLRVVARWSLQDSKIKFPLAHRIIRPAHKAFRATFTANRPTTFYS